ncbi:enoyl-CoA hydratase-related protein [Salipiger abyssi]|uniref:enoyl-CoA hydratase-related protein n=1 Tax=Salipiger abyssi TaxID=1250539 RepID=UPI001A8F4C00|nr:enoyl-CoA hydratase-related protein [Salipiger abyssi]MBN9890083.1 enoyl-CoA hydratase/isomerase family protein [Salipiger abyssi]
MTEARDAVEYSYRDGIVWLGVSEPPANALTRAAREALLAALERALAEPEAQAVVLHGRGKSFPVALDADDLLSLHEVPSLAELCARIETAPIPVVAAMHGAVLGGGLELALAAHYRIAHASARIGLPAVQLGLLPAAGGTQRLPRMLGAGAALDIMLSGASFAVDRAPARGLVDAVAESDLLGATTVFVRKLLTDGRGPRRSSEMRQGFADAMAYQQEVARRREAVAARPELAPREIVAAVEAAMLLPFEAGLAFEADAFDACRTSEQSKALRGAQTAERRALRFGLPAGTELPDLRRVAVLGGGGLAAQIVFAALNAGLSVNWGTRDPARLRIGVPQVNEMFRQSVARGAISDEMAQERMARLRVGDSADMTADSDMILHAARGQADVPAPDHIVRASVFTDRVERLGLRFALPVHGMRLVEVIAGPSVGPEQLAAALSLARALGKLPVKVVSSGDSLASRLMGACQRAADALVDLGQDPYEIDRALRDWGWQRPPFQLRDQIGLDKLAQRERAEGAHNWSALLLGQGRGGRAQGKGVYEWSEGGAQPDPGLSALLEAERPPAKPMPPDLIRKLIFGAMANEGARMLASGMAARPSDIDIVAVMALDLPRWRGGPMHLAGVMGLLSMRRAMEALDHPDRAFWRPQPVFADLIKNGRSFDDLNGR